MLRAVIVNVIETENIHVSLPTPTTHRIAVGIHIDSGFLVTLITLMNPLEVFQAKASTILSLPNSTRRT